MKFIKRLALALALWFAIGPAAWAAITFDTLVANASAISGTTITDTVSVTTGQGIVLWVASSGNVSPSLIADTGSNTYIAIGSAVYNSNDDQTVTQYYVKSAATTGSIVITVTWASAQATRGVAAVPLSGHDATATPAGIVGPQQINIATTDGITTTNVTPSAQPGSFIAIDRKSVV